jgi:hypothetical protein
MSFYQMHGRERKQPSRRTRKTEKNKKVMDRTHLSVSKT